MPEIEQMFEGRTWSEPRRLRFYAEASLRREALFAGAIYWENWWHRRPLWRSTARLEQFAREFSANPPWRGVPMNGGWQYGKATLNLIDAAESDLSPALREARASLLEWTRAWGVPDVGSASAPAAVVGYPGVVYFIQGGDAIKIGFATDLANRVAELQRMSPIRLVVLGSLPGDRRAEAVLHRRFRQYRTHGEWFAASPEILRFVEESTDAAGREVARFARREDAERVCGEAPWPA